MQVNIHIHYPGKVPRLTVMWCKRRLTLEECINSEHLMRISSRERRSRKCRSFQKQAASEESSWRGTVRVKGLLRRCSCGQTVGNLRFRAMQSSEQSKTHHSSTALLLNERNPSTLYGQVCHSTRTHLCISVDVCMSKCRGGIG
ncbi:unnamed protein product [Onchocerca flexuosa]|uniref:Ovule protein n=1 Tax=Onchocerca flexuosa TaxID=387005 RepID=A0A183HEN7_9BILA|nr:unnamed protein product [Onchocerca flexuosa]